ncbi:MAG: portal protein [Acidobacteria bacterium RIFCSPLOWO2_12_FULL_65_11]|nr:MAG: portal protein [Acidobacteria bacterium RIFCSPLOWO2_02_FULL_64_15]OFW28340.1 MAG: portal protein [Acidobacteria bacterium RIFCSPLOWO2_12_FULL_65_11]
MDLVADLTLVLLAALVGGFLAQRLGQPLIVGYIVAGVAVGPFTAGPTVGNVHNIEQLAELGVALLLFSLGLELSFRELAPVRKVALAGATIQVVVTIALGLGLGLALGWAWRPALWFGALVSLSSTMVALKTIQAQGRLGTLSSRVMLGMLVVQDLAVVPLMIVLPELSDPAGGLVKIGTAALRATLLLGVIVFFSTRVVPRLMAFVARRNSRELFFLSTITLAVGVGYVAWLFGLSMAIGAFVAGLVVNESEYAHQALSDIVPLRDLFGMLFFVSVGMLLDPALVRQQIGVLGLVVVAIIVGKAAILAGVVRAFGYWNIVPLAVGLTLFQVGEFAFVLARVGQSSGAISNDVYSLTLNTAIVTMALTPVVSGLVPVVYGRFWPRRAQEAHEAINLPSGGLSDHVVVAGSGRVGRSIADALSHLKLPCVLVEVDDRRVQQTRAAGLPVIYGDSSQPVVLEAAGILRARAILVTVPAFPDVRSIVRAVRQLRPDLPIIARADGFNAVRALYALGIQEVTSPEFEAAIEMTRQALMYFNVPAHDVLRVARAIRRERYGQTGEKGDSGLLVMSQLGDIARQLDFTWVGVPSESSFDGRTLSELQIRTTTGASVVGIIRDGALVANPDGQARLERGDLVAVLGTRDQIARFEQAVQAGAA